MDGYLGEYVVFVCCKEEIWYIVGINGMDKEILVCLDFLFVVYKQGVFLYDGLEGQILKGEVLVGLIVVCLLGRGGFVIKI